MMGMAGCTATPNGDEVVTKGLPVDALVPVRGAEGGKARLARLLTPTQRAALVRAMLQDVVEALRTVPALRTVAVTSADAALLDFAVSLGARALPEPPGTDGLNGALAAAIDRLQAAGAGVVLIVQGDVPEIGPADVGALLAGVGTRGPLIRAAPAADGGTSALVLCPPDAILPAFGPQSFRRHRAAAAHAGVPFERCVRPALAVDIDRPADAIRLLGSARAPHTRAALTQAGIVTHPEAARDKMHRRGGRRMEA